jgi:hypothetical protein
MPRRVEEVAFFISGAVIAFWAGGRAARSADRAPLWAAAVAGALVASLDHLVLTGGAVLRGYITDSHAIPFLTRSADYLMVFWGVVISFVMFVPIAMLIGVAGGLLRRRPRPS